MKHGPWLDSLCWFDLYRGREYFVFCIPLFFYNKFINIRMFQYCVYFFSSLYSLYFFFIFQDTFIYNPQTCLILLSLLMKLPFQFKLDFKFPTTRHFCHTRFQIPPIPVPCRTPHIFFGKPDLEFLPFLLKFLVSLSQCTMFLKFWYES